MWKKWTIKGYHCYEPSLNSLNNKSVRPTVVFCCDGLVLVIFTHIIQGCFTGTGAYNCPSASEGTLNDVSMCITWTHRNWCHDHKTNNNKIICICHTYVVWKFYFNLHWDQTPKFLISIPFCLTVLHNYKLTLGVHSESKCQCNAG